MKIIIAGGRDLRVSPLFIRDKLQSHGIRVNDITHVISGKCRGVDTTGEEFAKNHGIQIIECPAKWKIHGTKAGPIRNREMAQIGDLLLLIWDGKSRGSGGMKREMKALDKPVLEVIL
jgi:hypothetical protein